jgi:outer membrane protein assembly factor BamB
MRDAEDELSQQESAVEITPLSQEKEVPEAEQLSVGMTHENTLQSGRANHSSTRRYILTSLALCLVLALFLTIVVVQLHQPAKPSSQANSLVASPTATPSYIPTDYSVNTTIVNGVAYAGAANGAVYALRASDGNVLWRHKIDPGANAALIVNAGIIYITTTISDVGPGSLYALRASDGKELWRYSSSDAVGNLLVANGIAYVTSYDVVSQNGSLIALRASDGAELWHETARGLSYNAPVVDNQVVYVSTSADNGLGTVYALRANNGTQLWHYTTTTFTSVSLVVNGIAYLVSDQILSALQASDGQLLWKVPVEGNTNILPQVINGVLYLTTTKISLEATVISSSHVGMLSQVGTIGNLLQSVVPMASVKQTLPLKQGLSSVYAVRINDGSVLWHYSMSKEKGNNWANWFSIENGTVYVGTYVDQDKSYIYALRSNDGSLLWRQATHQGMPANAYVANGVIYIASFINNGSINDGSGAVYALRASDGAQLWYHPIYWVVYNPPMLVGATLYVSTGGGEVYAFQASNGSLLWHFHTDVQ